MSDLQVIEAGLQSISEHSILIMAVSESDEMVHSIVKYLIMIGVVVGRVATEPLFQLYHLLYIHTYIHRGRLVCCALFRILLVREIYMLYMYLDPL